MAVWEVAQLTVPKRKQDEFESVVRSHLPLFKEADGCLDVKMFRAVDKEDVVLLCVQWQSMEHHTKVFVKTEAFAKFISAVRPFFAAPPAVFHASTVIDGI